MRLNASQWMASGGRTPEWKKVLASRSQEALSALKAVGTLLRKDQPSSLKRLKLPQSIAAFLKAPARLRDPLARFPALDCWLSLSETFFDGGRPREAWEVHFPFFQGFAAALAVARKATQKIPVRLDPSGRFHASGSRAYFEFGSAYAGKDAVAEVRAGQLRVIAFDGSVGRAGELSLITPSMWVEHRDPLVLQPIRVQAAASPSKKEEARFAEVLAASMKKIRRYDADLYDEMNDFLRLVVPLKNPENRGSVSSSYQNLRGAFCLSHAEDGLLQEETLIHEFCHQKLNLVTPLDPMLEPGQGAQIFFSPLRPDARRLRGLLLGAHAFLNINRYLLIVRAKEKLSAEAEDSLVRNVGRRMFHCEEMLRAVSGYTSLTDFGSRCTLHMWRELMRQYHIAETFPEGVMEEARKIVQAQRDDHALGYTGMHRRPELDAKQAAAAAKGKKK